MRKSILTFIKDHKVEIDAFIHETLGKKIALNNEERRMWILNHETLYKWALSEGVNI